MKTLPILEILFFQEREQRLFGAEINLNGKFFKEIAGLASIEDVLTAIAENNDIIETLTKTK